MLVCTLGSLKNISELDRFWADAGSGGPELVQFWHVYKDIGDQLNIQFCSIMIWHIAHEIAHSAKCTGVDIGPTSFPVIFLTGIKWGSYVHYSWLLSFYIHVLYDTTIICVSRPCENAVIYQKWACSGLMLQALAQTSTGPVLAHNGMFTRHVTRMCEHVSC